MQADVTDVGSNPGSGRSPGGEYSNPLQYSCLENPTERSLVAHSPQGHKSWTELKRLSTQARGHLHPTRFCFPTLHVHLDPGPTLPPTAQQWPSLSGAHECARLKKACALHSLKNQAFSENTQGYWHLLLPDLPGAVMGDPARDEVMKKILGRQGRPGPHP